MGLGIGIAHGFATLGTIGFEGRFDYAAIGTVSNVASRLCDDAKPGQILISPRVLMKVENAVQVEAVDEFALKGIRRPLRRTTCYLHACVTCATGSNAASTISYFVDFFQANCSMPMSREAEGQDCCAYISAIPARKYVDKANDPFRCTK